MQIIQIALLTALVTLGYSVAQGIRRWGYFIGAFTAVGGLGLYLYLLFFTNNALNIGFPKSVVGSLFLQPSVWFVFLFTLAAALMVLTTALFLYDRYAEV